MTIEFIIGFTNSHSLTCLLALFYAKLCSTMNRIFEDNIDRQYSLIIYILLKDSILINQSLK